MPTQHNSKHEEASNRWRRTGRCCWILEDPTFQQWRAEGGFLWFYGIRTRFSPVSGRLALTGHSAGSGKTTLMSGIIKVVSLFNSYPPSIDLKSSKISRLSLCRGRPSLITIVISWMSRVSLPHALCSIFSLSFSPMTAGG